MLLLNCRALSRIGKRVLLIDHVVFVPSILICRIHTMGVIMPRSAFRNFVNLQMALI